MGLREIREAISRSRLQIKNLPPKKNLKLSKFRISVPSFAEGFGRAGGIFGQILAAAGGEMRPNYFKNRPFLFDTIF